jgi:hypothetical protein
MDQGHIRQIIKAALTRFEPDADAAARIAERAGEHTRPTRMAAWLVAAATAAALVAALGVSAAVTHRGSATGSGHGVPLGSKAGPIDPPSTHQGTSAPPSAGQTNPTPQPATTASPAPGTASAKSSPSPSATPYPPCSPSQVSGAVSTGAQSYKQGQIVGITATLRNDSGQSCAIPAGWNMTVRDGSGATAYECPPPDPDAATRAMGPPQPWPPGASTKATCAWNTQGAKAGNYAVTIIWNLGGGVTKTATSAPFEVSTPQSSPSATSGATPPILP